MSLIRACCCSILSPFHKFELRKNTLNSFVQILNLTGVASFVSVSGFKSTFILTLSVSCGCSIWIGVASFGVTSRQSVTFLLSLALSAVIFDIFSCVDCIYDHQSFDAYVDVVAFFGVFVDGFV